MDWATVTLVFVATFVVFTTQYPDQKKSLSRPPAKRVVQKKAPAAEPQNLTYTIPDQAEVSLNRYQKIVSYIMDTYKQVVISDVLSIAENIVSYSTEYNVDPYLITALISVESSFNKKAVSSSGAKGLGQLMPFNFKTYGIKNPFDIEQNVRGTVRMMSQLIKRWDGDVTHALASYYEGPNAIQSKYGKPFRESTSAYVNKTLARHKTIRNY